MSETTNEEKPQRKIDNNGFSLLELMVVIVIIGILATAVTLNFMDAPDEARVNKAKMDIATLEQAVEMYKLDNGVYPTTDMGLQALIEQPSNARKWREGGYLKKKFVPKDPWGTEYIYLSPGVHGNFDIISFGADKVAGGEGFNADINSWEIE